MSLFSRSGVGLPIKFVACGEGLADLASQANQVCFNLVLQTMGRAFEWQRTLQLLASTLHMPLLPDAIGVNAALGAWRRGLAWGAAARLFLEGIGLQAIRPNQILLSTCAAACQGVWELAGALFDGAAAVGTALDRISRNAQLSVFQDSGRWKRAAELAGRHSPDTAGCNAVASACEHWGLWVQAVALMRRMAVESVRPDTITANSIISCGEKQGIWTLAGRLLQSFSLSPSPVTFAATISSAGKAAKWQVSLGLLQDGLRSSLHSLVGCSAAVSACEKGSQWLAAAWILRRMVELRLPLEQVALHAALSAAAGTGKWQWALNLHQAMYCQRVPSDIIGHNAILSALEHHGRWPYAARLLEGLPQSGARCTSISFNAVISTFEKAAEWRRAIALLPQLVGRQLALQDMGCNAAMTACQKGEQWRRATRLLGYMRGRGVAGTDVTCNALLSACETGACWHQALSLLRGFLARAMRLGDLACNALLGSCTGAGQWRSGLEVFRLMLSRRIRPDMTTYSSVAQLCEDGGRFRSGGADGAEAAAVLPTYLPHQTCVAHASWRSHIARHREHRCPPRPEGPKRGRATKKPTLLTASRCRLTCCRLLEEQHEGSNARSKKPRSRLLQGTCSLVSC
ncbi:unnamed protein product [Symbiodinium natans]|uniref:Pentatricopeptide repeat-containing protein, chloroplastic n=1 Tax=Symbiodinium natans TaxID=878477 RepID=A0A812QM87_9DINO|nr:unnamed protein product [Symbiodinium natans]